MRGTRAAVAAGDAAAGLLDGRADAGAAGDAAAADGSIGCAFVLRPATGTGACGRESTSAAGRVSADECLEGLRIRAHWRFDGHSLSEQFQVLGSDAQPLPLVL